MVIEPWLEALRRERGGQVTRIELAESREWRLSEGRIVHNTGGFFAICGLEAQGDGLPAAGWRSPIIEQPEVGLLGFLRHSRPGGALYLLQGKSEPGSMNWVQVGPSVQATKSNYLRRHRGQATRFMEYFTIDRAPGLRGTLQSEQGSRFLLKFNRNAVAEVSEPVEADDPAWRWAPAAELRRALLQDFTVNTDARSVLACVPWAGLSDSGLPFQGSEGEVSEHAALRAALAEAYRSGAADRLRQRVSGQLARLHAVRAGGGPTFKRVPLSALPRERPEDGSEIVHYAVHAPGREIENWDQPFVTTQSRAEFHLVLAGIRDRNRLGFSISREPGFGSLVQFGPSAQRPGPETDLGEMLAARRPEMKLSQSDEGGRFFNMIASYCVHDLRGEALPDSAMPLVWLDPAEVEALCGTPGIFTNEARTLISMLLALA